MKTTITKLFMAIVAIVLFSANLSAQQAETMYVMKNGVVAYQSEVSDIDSIIFYAPPTPEPEPTSGDGWVLINGVKWATCNVDAPGTFAAAPESAGMFYQWNRKIAWSATDPMVNSNGGTTWDSSVPEGTEWTKANDPSPAGYRVPTSGEIQSLLDEDKVTNEWTDNYNGTGVSGRIFTDKNNGNSIFLPAVGYRISSDGTLYLAGSYGYYWSSTQLDSGNAYTLYFLSSIAVWGSCYREFGQSVRPVAE
jgi:uncharacterized protein (TIGR02145 family)